jgi:Ca2+/H+ antiporter
MRNSLFTIAHDAFCGTLITFMVLLPALSMITGGFVAVRKRASPVAIIECVLLVICMVGTFTPTVFYSVYGRSQLIASELHLAPKGQYPTIEE